jgi:uracil-DNA glycosylase family 4
MARRESNTTSSDNWLILAVIAKTKIVSMKALSKQFGELCSQAHSCRICPDLADKTAVLSKLNGNLRPKVFFIGEAPGRTGADRTRRPFYGDKSGNNFQELLDSIGLDRADTFITSAVMCSPRSMTDANRRPKRTEIKNCSSYLKRVVELIEPPLIATLGSVALEALKLIEYHGFTLSEHAGTRQKWQGRTLVPLYHPSPQVIASQRGSETQLKHFQVLKKIIDEIERYRNL